MADAPEALRSRLPVWAMLVGALILGLGLAGAGFLIGRGFEQGRSADRYVTVKGLAETFVTADLAVWPLRITATGEDLARVQEQIDYLGPRLGTPAFLSFARASARSARSNSWSAGSARSTGIANPPITAHSTYPSLLGHGSPARSSR
jgi:hypothetical protein